MSSPLVTRPLSQVIDYHVCEVLPTLPRGRDLGNTYENLHLIGPSHDPGFEVSLESI